MLRRFLLGTVLASALVSASLAVESEEASLDPEALGILHAMAETLASTEALAVVADVAFDVVQDDGQALEFGSLRTMTIHRPDRLRVDLERRDGQRGGMTFDGQRLIVWDADENVWAAVEHAGSIDELVDFAQSRLDQPVPLGELFSSDLVASVVESVRAGELVGTERIAGVACHHLAFQNDVVDFQLWVQREGPPLPHRLVIVYREEEGSPRFRAAFSGWNLAPEIGDGIFSHRPADAERIPFVVPRRLVEEETEG